MNTKDKKKRDSKSNCSTKGQWKRGNSKRKSNDSDVKADAYKGMPAANDFSWYNKNMALVQASANVPFPYRPGMSLPAYAKVCKPGTETDARTVEHMNTKMPGIFTLKWYPTIGVSTNVTSPASLAARDIFSKVRAEFSGSISADAPDFMIQIMALDSIFAYISWAKRVYKTLNTFNADNLLTPECILRSMGFTTDTVNALKRDRTKLFGLVNELVAMTDRFIVPDIMPVITRHMWLSERMYCDAPFTNSQLYMFEPGGFFKFAIDDQGAGMLTNVELTPSSFTGVDDIFNYGVELISALSNWDDCYIINGYLQKTFGSDKLVRLEPVNLTDRVELMYNEVVLSQIENAVCTPVKPQPGEQSAIVNEVRQNPTDNSLISVSKVSVQAALADDAVTWDKMRLNSHMEHPTPEDVIESSRLITVWNYDGKGHFIPTTCGTEFVTTIAVTVSSGPNEWQIYYLNNVTLAYDVVNQLKGSVINSQVKDYLRCVNYVSSFDWHPIMLSTSIRKTKVDETHTSWTYETYINGDLRNLTFLSTEELDHINRCCLYSEFNSFTG